MMPQDVELEKLRLIDDFLEDDSDNPLANDAFDTELELAIAAAEKSKLRRIRRFIERDKNVAWKSSLSNVRLLFRNSNTF
ncbi:hypothetical protein [Sphingomonas parapaucimobilis]|uniref:hypothetical protein n=1 Tax=Sphingomonas parapaucimobilis TaxID=28213 RepID=UPI0032191C1B